MLRTSTRAPRKPLRRTALVVALTAVTTLAVLAALPAPPAADLASARATLPTHGPTADVARTATDRAPLESFAGVVPPAGLDEIALAALTPQEQKQLNKLQKSLTKAEAKLSKREAKLADWQAKLAAAQQAHADALLLPTDTKKQTKARNKAIKKALKRIAKAQKRIAYFQARIAKSEGVVAVLTAAILELDPTAFDDEPAVPANLVAVADSDSVLLDWSLVPGATSYSVYWSSSPDVDPATADTMSVATSSAVIDGLGVEETVYAVVTAWTGTAESDPSSEISATTALESGDLVPDVVVSRASGVAPLSVFFDATGTTSGSTDQPFHDLSYAWDFGDETAGTWATTGKSRGTARGPVAAHVFEEPGIHTVTLLVRDADGNVAQHEVQVNVADPDVVFLGAQTVCVSQTGNFGGAPTGSLKVTTSDWSQAMSHVASGKRVLLRRGESWSASASVKINEAGPGMIGAFGDPAAPRPVVSASSVVFELSGKTPAFDDWRFVDLEVTTGGAHHAFQAQGAVSQMTVLRCDLVECNRGIELGDGIIEYWNNNGTPMPYHDGLVVADTTIRDAAYHHLYVASSRLALLGSTFDTSINSHILRLTYVGQGVISNCEVRGATSSRHEMKLHAPNYSGAGFGAGIATEELVVSDNTFESVNSAWSIRPGPQNGERDERLHDVLFERNLFRAGPSTTVLVNIAATDSTFRNNVFDMSGATSCIGVNVAPGSIEPQPDGTVIVNNTFYRSDSASVIGVDIEAETSNSIVCNNLGYAPNSPTAALTILDGQGVLASHNLLSVTSPFVSANPTEATDFRLAPASTAIDSGTIVPGLYYDFDLNTSPVDGDGDGTPVPDVGAFEAN